MSSALEAVQQALVAALAGYPPLTDAVSGIYDGPPPRARFPYIALATGAALDWSHKGGMGRELSLALTVHDDGQNAAQLHQVMGLVERLWPPDCLIRQAGKSSLLIFAAPASCAARSARGAAGSKIARAC